MPLTYGTTATGERVLYPALLLDGRVYFTTAILDTTDPCSSAGSSKLMEVDAESGQRITNFNIFGGLESTSGLVISGGLVNTASFVAYQDAAGNDMVGIQTPNTGDSGQGPSGGVYDPGSNINRRIMWQQRQ